MTTFEFVALTLPGSADPSIAIAASRAGGIGVVDVSLVCDEQRAVRAVRRLARFARNRCGVRIDPADEAIAETVISALPSLVGLAIVAPAAPDVLCRQAERLRAQGVEPWLEATSLDEALLAAAAASTASSRRGTRPRDGWARRPRWCCSNSCWPRSSCPSGPKAGSASTQRRRARSPARPVSRSTRSSP